MAQFENKTRNKAGTDPELLLAQWPEFDQEHYLKAENGMDGYQSIIEYISAKGVTKFVNNLKPGVTKNESINRFRNIRLENTDIGALVSPQFVDGIPLSLFKAGVNASYDSSKIDAGELVGCRLEDLSLNSIFAPFLSIKSSLLKNTISDKAVLYGAKISDSYIENYTISNCKIGPLTFEDCVIKEVDIKGIFETSSQSESKLFNNSIIRGGIVQNCIFTNTYFDYSLIVGLDVNRTDFIDSVGAENMAADGLTIKKSSFTNGAFQLSFSNSCNLIKCDFRNSVLHGNNNPYGGLIWNGEVVGCEFSNAQIRDIFFSNGVRVNCSFRQADFSGDLFGSSPFIGCDFTNSNIDELFPTKSDFNNQFTGSKNNIWVDGTVF